MRKSAMLQPPNILTPKMNLKNNLRAITSEQYHPQRWLMHPLVVQDPFVFTHVRLAFLYRSCRLSLTLLPCFQNHAQFVSRVTVDFFVSSCLRSWAHLSRGQPFLNVFGPSLQTESLSTYPLGLDKTTVSVKNPAKEQLRLRVNQDGLFVLRNMTG
jgi:hypothetical protein